MGKKKAAVAATAAATRKHHQQRSTTDGSEQLVRRAEEGTPGVTSPNHMNSILMDFPDIPQHDENDPANWRVTIGITPQSLLEQWKQIRDPQPTMIAFYQDRKGNLYREFSNFYQHKDHGFDFVLPQELLDIATGIIGGRRDNDNDKRQRQQRDILFEPIVHCEFSEKAIMLCKAAIMGNSEYYKRIANSKTPTEVKKLGRQITPWNDKLWESVVCGVAMSVIRQKFTTTNTPALRDVLLSTGEDKILCEATAGDRRWACGISIKMPKVYEIPSRWKGSNVLGWALMQVRQEIINSERAKEQQQQQRRMMEQQEIAVETL